MIKPSATIKDVINLLNEAVKLDQQAMENLVSTRVECNTQLLNHPTIQCTSDNRVGLLGVINGIFGIDDRFTGVIAASYNDDGKLTGFIEL